MLRTSNKGLETETKKYYELLKLDDMCKNYLV